jgi:hypothetical protein
MQEAKARADELDVVFTLEKELRGLPVDFVLSCPERRLLAHGVLRRVEEPAPPSPIYVSRNSLPNSRTFSHLPTLNTLYSTTNNHHTNTNNNSSEPASPTSPVSALSSSTTSLHTSASTPSVPLTALRRFVSRSGTSRGAMLEVYVFSDFVLFANRRSSSSKMLHVVENFGLSTVVRVADITAWSGE